MRWTEGLLRPSPRVTEGSIRVEKPYPPRSGDPLTQFNSANCTCSFCLLVFSLSDPSERDLRTFRSHLQAKHGLKLGEPEP